MKKNSVKEKKELKAAKEKARFHTPESLMHFKFAVSRGLTIYPAGQSDGKAKLFKQFGENFKELDSIIYDQTDEGEVLEMLYRLRQGYKDYYLKFKDK